MSKRKELIFITICEGISDIIKRLSLFLAGAFLLINIGVIIMSVFLRYFFHYSPIWTEEVAMFALIWAVMFGAVAAFSYGEHVSITAVEKFMPEITGKIMRYFRHILIVGILGFMVYVGVNYVSSTWKFRTLALDIPKAIPLMSIPIGMGLMLLQYILLEIVSRFKR
ncbi:hypothetical protein ES705_11753 [subsurface metagenome]